MSKIGLPLTEILDTQGSQDLTIAIIASRWHNELVDSLISCAKEVAHRQQVTNITVYRTQGVMEIPVIAQTLAPQVDAIVALGAVIAGETPHFMLVSQTVTEALMQISLEHRTPIAHGILATHNLKQAHDRAGFADSTENKGAEAMVAAIDTALQLIAIRKKLT